MKKIKLGGGDDNHQRSEEPTRHYKGPPCNDIVELSKQYPLFSEDPLHLKHELKESVINDPNLKYG